MYSYIILVVLLCYCGAQQIYDFNVTITPSRQSWNDVIVDSDCDVFGIGFPSNVSLSDVHVSVQGIQEESEVWIGSSVIYTPWIKIGLRADRKIRRHQINWNTIKDCYDQCKVAFVIGHSVLPSCKCGGPPDNLTRLDYLYSRAYIVTHLLDDIIVDVSRGYAVFEPVDIPPDSSIGNCKTVWLSDGNVSLLTTPCSSCREGLLLYTLNPRFSFFRSLFFIKFDDYSSDELKTAMETYNITSACVAVFRDQTFQWYNKDQPQNDPLHCLSAVITNGSLSPRVRQCDTKLAAMCVGSTTRPISDDDTTITSRCACQSFHIGVIVGAISEVVIAIAMVIVFVVCMYRNRKKSERFQREPQTSGQNQLYSSLDQADRSPPPVYGVVGAPDHYIALNQTDRAPPSVYGMVSSQDHVYDEASQNRTG